MEIAKTVRAWFSNGVDRVADKATELGTGSFPVMDSLPATNNVTTPEERDAVVARSVLIQKAIKAQLGTTHD